MEALFFPTKARTAETQRHLEAGPGQTDLLVGSRYANREEANNSKQQKRARGDKIAADDEKIFLPCFYKSVFWSFVPVEEIMAEVMTAGK